MTELREYGIPQLREHLDQLTDALSRCDAVVHFKKLSRQIEESPEKKKRLMEFRKKNFLLQNAQENVDVFSESVRLKSEYADLFRDPLTADFLAAEVVVCRIMQIINRDLISCLDFEAVPIEGEV